MGIFDKLLKNSSKTEPKLNEMTKGKNPQAFDYKKEKELLSEYKKYKGKQNSFEYFTALPMIDFYYKFRNLDNKYLDECIKYCYICISCLDSPDMKEDIKTGIHIPAFKKLVIIYENQKEYDKAAFYSEQALKYTKKDSDDAIYYSKKMKTLMNKKYSK